MKRLSQLDIIGVLYDDGARGMLIHNAQDQKYSVIINIPQLYSMFSTMQYSSVEDILDEKLIIKGYEFENRQDIADWFAGGELSKSAKIIITENYSDTDTIGLTCKYGNKHFIVKNKGTYRTDCLNDTGVIDAEVNEDFSFGSIKELVRHGAFVDVTKFSNKKELFKWLSEE